MPDRQKPHFLLNARTGIDALSGWRADYLQRVRLLEGDGTLRLMPIIGAGRQLVDESGSFGGLTLPTGLAVDAEDRIYILDTAANVIKRFDPCLPRFETLPCIAGPGSEPRQVRDARGIAISNTGDLYVADTGNRRIQVFALKGLPLRAIWGPYQVVRDETGVSVKKVAPLQASSSEAGECLTEPLFPEGTWQPWDIVLSSAHWAYVTDYANGLIHIFDPWGHWRRTYSEESPGVALDKPTHIALDREGKLYVVQEGKEYVLVLDREGQPAGKIQRPDEVPGRFCPTAIAVDEAGNIHLGERFSRRIYTYSSPGDGCYTCDGASALLDAPIEALAFDKQGNPLVIDAGRKQVRQLEPLAEYEEEGSYYSTPLDSETYRCRWHSVVVCVSLPKDTMLRVDTFTSEALKTTTEIIGLPEARWKTGQVMNSNAGDQEWECLVQSLPGRYLWLRFTLMGNGLATPQVCWAEVYYPRESSLQYLPAIYSEDETGLDFMARFLSIFDSIRDGIGSRIGAIASMFDPMSTPAGEQPGEPDFLSWLASWIGLTLERHWPAWRRRRLVQQAHKLYSLRGTPEGLRQHIELYTGYKPQILEHFKLRRWLFLDSARLGDQSALWGKEIVDRLQLGENSQIGSFQLVDSGDPLHDPFYYYAHQFTVFVPLPSGGTDTQKHTLRRIVEMAKPAHALGNLQLYEPRFRVGHAFVGVDTIVSQYPEGVVESEGKLGFDTVLGPSTDEGAPPTMRVGVRARIGSSTLID